jgi:hypothetical protein
MGKLRIQLAFYVIVQSLELDKTKHTSLLTESEHYKSGFYSTGPWSRVSMDTVLSRLLP